MGIRKFGQRDGEVTGVEGIDPDQIRRTAAHEPWDSRDDEALAEENAAADRAGGDD